MTIEEIIEALAQDFADNPQEDHLSRVSLIEALSIPYVSNVISEAVFGAFAGKRPGDVEEELRENEVRDAGNTIAGQLSLIQRTLADDPTSPLLGEAMFKLNRHSSYLVENLAILGAVVFLSRQTIPDCNLKA